MTAAHLSKKGVTTTGSSTRPATSAAPGTGTATRAACATSSRTPTSRCSKRSATCRRRSTRTRRRSSSTASSSAAHFDMYPHALFQTEVTGMVWDEATKRWLVTTSRDDRLSARFVVICGGVLHKAKLPGIPGIETFQGHAFHTSRWDYAYTGGGPEEPMDKLHDKVVAIIGTGATGVQAVPKLAEAAKHLYVFQRTPSSVARAPAAHRSRVVQRDVLQAGLARGAHGELHRDDHRREPAGRPRAGRLDRDVRRRHRRLPKDDDEGADARAARLPQHGARSARASTTSWRTRPPPRRSSPGTGRAASGPATTTTTCRRSTAERHARRHRRPGRRPRHGDRHRRRGVEYPVDCSSSHRASRWVRDYTHRLGFDPKGTDGVLAVRGVGQGRVDAARHLTHGFPNLLMNSHAGRPAHQLRVHAHRDGQAHRLHDRPLPRRRRRARRADDRRGRGVVPGHHGHARRVRRYHANCTPGYLNNEGMTPENLVAAARSGVVHGQRARLGEAPPGLARGRHHGRARPEALIDGLTLRRRG